MAKFCCDPDSADMSRKSGSMRVLTGPNPLGIGRGVYLFSCPQISSMSCSAFGAGISVRIVFLNFSSCSCNPWICSWRDSSKNFFRRRLRFACSRFRSRRSSFCFAVSCPPVVDDSVPGVISSAGRFFESVVDVTAKGSGGGATIPADAAGSPATVGRTCGAGAATGTAATSTGAGAGATGAGAGGGWATPPSPLACWLFTMSDIPGTS
mmetsp:Transcript_44619/g.92958  ORF Transcript_44619/g.92958 Transcript_44619/m.92958 type:complete len:209 (+) Transcript_44619:754-1380(+)